MGFALPFLWILCSYLLGSIPFAYIVSKALRGIDIRRYGTRNVGGSNVFENVSKPAVVVVGVLDMAKAGFAYWMGVRLGLGLGLSLAAGLAAIVGHDWPIYLRFHGGRGLSPSLGVLIVAYPLGFFWALLMIAAGFFTRKNATLALAGFLTLPALAYFTGQPRQLVWATVAMLLLVIIKRLEANREPLPAGPERWQVLARRLLLDRDIQDWERWAHRRPDAGESSED